MDDGHSSVLGSRILIVVIFLQEPMFRDSLKMAISSIVDENFYTKDS